MRKLTILVGVLLAGASVPAAAQYGSGGNLDLRIQQLQAQIQANVQSGRLSRGEAESLRGELRALRQLERQYSQDGLSSGERNDLQNRIQQLRQRIQSANRNEEYRDRDRDGRYDRDDRRDGRRYDRRDDDDRYERDDDDDRYGRDDRFNGRFCPPGLAKKNNGCVPPGLEGRGMREGDRYREGMGSPLPARYRDQFRDTDRYFHRFDGRNVYRIDRRTLIIVAIIVVVR